jgi:WD40 repeat protein
MARIFRYYGKIATAFAVVGLFLAPAFGQDLGPNAGTDLYDRPVLAIDLGMHTGSIKSLAVDADGRIGVTGGSDRALRIWSVLDGALLRTIWMPVGPEPIGEIYAVAISPDGSTVAAGGWTERSRGGTVIYLFDRASGAMIKRIYQDLPNVVNFLTFSPDGRYLAATLGGDNGLRVFGRDKNWDETFRDIYVGDSYGAAFAPDGGLATSSTGGNGTIRLYDSHFRLVGGGSMKSPTGDFPYHLSFNPDGRVLAVGYAEIAAVDLLDGRSLHRLPGPLPANVRAGPSGLGEVAWSRDGRTLLAAGTAFDTEGEVLVAWDAAGRGKIRLLHFCGSDSVRGLGTLPDNRILVGSMAPCLELTSPEGKRAWTIEMPIADLRNQEDALAISVDGNLVDFSIGDAAKTKLRFDVRSLHLTEAPIDNQTFPPNHAGLPIEGWRLGGVNPRLRGHAISSGEYYESLAIAEDSKQFFLGSNLSLAAFDDTGARKWRHDTRYSIWALNASKDGRVFVAADSDGTIRWHRADDGRELLALQVLPKTRDWILWTPEGFYEATPGAQDVLKWVTNHGPDKPATTLPVSAIPRLHRPDALQFVLDELSTKGALGVADLSGARLAVQTATGSAKPPGGVLRVLAIGVDTFGLRYAADDARAVASALSDSQKIGAGKASLYADVVPVPLVDEQASGTAILEAIDDLIRSMRKSVADQDVAVILFSGHGEVIENKYYLIPYGVDVSTPTKMERSSVWIEEFAAKIKDLAQRGRVLLLFDACHSGAVGPGGASPVLDAGVLRDALNSNNVTVLTSSDKDELSREDRAWGHGAFTKAFLDALAGGADPNSRGAISTADLAVAMRSELERLSGGKQHLGMHMNFADDVFVTGQ